MNFNYENEMKINEIKRKYEIISFCFSNQYIIAMQKKQPSFRGLFCNLSD